MLDIGISLELAPEMTEKNEVREEAVLFSLGFICSSIGYKRSLQMFSLVKLTWYPDITENRAANVTIRGISLKFIRMHKGHGIKF